MDSLAGSLRTKVGLGMGPMAWQAQWPAGCLNPREAEDKASVRLSLSLEFLSQRSAECTFSLTGQGVFSQSGEFVPF